MSRVLMLNHLTHLNCEALRKIDVNTTPRDISMELRRSSVLHHPSRRFSIKGSTQALTLFAIKDMRSCSRWSLLKTNKDFRSIIPLVTPTCEAWNALIASSEILNEEFELCTSRQLDLTACGCIRFPDLTRSSCRDPSTAAPPLTEQNY